MRKATPTRVLVVLLAAVCIPACADVPGDPVLHDTWTWVSGSTTPNAAGSYGTRGVPSPSNSPGARQLSAGWTGARNAFWLFGGLHSPGGPGGLYNDLWVWNGTAWTWMSGSNTPDHNGVYGVKGSPDPANMPGSRTAPGTWRDSSGRLWLFGGLGYAATGGYQYLNDLWCWNGLSWVWRTGTNQLDQPGVYGTQGVPAAANTPGGRQKPVCWTTADGVFWFFGGSGFGATTAPGNGHLSDLWRWDGSAWVWVSGPTVINDPAVYGTKGVAAAGNTPGGRTAAASWTDAAGHLWLFGGLRLTGGLAFTMNDLWRWDGTNWTWMAGTTAGNPSGVYGTQGLPDPANTPGGRDQSAGWVDANGNFWLYGGNGYNGSGSFAALDDLWRWDGATWTWMRGTTIGNSPGIYGTQGMADPANQPGGHSSLVPFTGADGSFWMWGGFGIGSPGSGDMNDLWRYTP